MKSNLYLIGSVHKDHEGSEKLERVLDFIKPATILVEAHPHRLEFYKNAVKKFDLDTIIKKTDLTLTQNQRNVLEQITQQEICAHGYGYEYFTAEEYSKKNSIPLICMDCAVFETPEELDLANSLFGLESCFQPHLRENLLEMLDKGIENYRQEKKEFIEEIYRVYSSRRADPQKEVAKLLLHGKEKEAALLQKICDPQRNSYMAEIIKNEYLPSQPKTIALCGLAHLSALEEQLFDLEPHAIPLHYLWKGLQKEEKK